MCSLPRLLRRALLASVGMVTLLAMFRGTTWGTDFAWAPSPLSADWDDPYNWVGPPAEFPNSSDDTALVNGIPTTGYDPTLTAHRLIGALTISNNGDVNTGDGAGNNYRLIARKGTHPGTILIEDPGSSLTIYSSEFFSDVTAEAMTINSGGDVYLRGGGATLEIKALDINVGGEVSGAGTIWINSVNQIVNDGEILRGTGRRVQHVDNSPYSRGRESGYGWRRRKWRHDGDGRDRALRADTNQRSV